MSRRQAKRAAFYARERRRAAIARRGGAWTWRDDQLGSIDWGACSFRAALYTGDNWKRDFFQREYMLDDCKEVDGSLYARGKP